MALMLMRVYYNPLSPYCHKLLYFLEETGLTYEPVLVEFSSFDFTEPQFLHISPAGQIPAIETEFGALSDSTVCMRYLCDRRLLHDFYPVHLEQRAEVDFWTEYVNQHVGRYIMSLAWQKYWMAKRQQPIDVNVIAANTAALEKYLPALERRLLGRHFLSGGVFTIADINLAAFMHQSAPAQLDLAGYPQLTRWFGEVKSRPAWRSFLNRMLLKADAPAIR